MKLINALSIIAAVACFPAAAQGPAAPEDRAYAVPKPEPPEGSRSTSASSTSCNDKGCPAQDQHGHPPVSCQYQYGISTGFRCILLCSYTDSQWGTIVDSSACK